MLTRVYRQAHRALFVHGPIASARIVYEKLTARHQNGVSDYDAAHGVVTDGNESLLDDPRHERYQPTAEPIIREMIESFPLSERPLEFDPFPRFTFIDVGSGKGRVLFVASEYPFRKIIGVEYARELHEAAAANLKTYTSPTQRCRDIDLACTDATTYALPAGPTVLFMANPFRGEIMAAFIRNVEESLRQHPRPFYVLYRQAKEAALWDASRSFKRMAETPMYTTWRAR